MKRAIGRLRVECGVDVVSFCSASDGFIPEKPTPLGGPFTPIRQQKKARRKLRTHAFVARLINIFNEVQQKPTSEKGLGTFSTFHIQRSVAMRHREIGREEVLPTRCQWNSYPGTLRGILSRAPHLKPLVLTPGS
jgi:hypothetical protein